MTDRGMARVWLPGELAERVRLAATEHGMTVQQLGEQLVLEGLEQYRRRQKREHGAANRARRAAAAHEVVGCDACICPAHENPGSPAPGEGRHDVEPSGSQDVVTPHCTPGPLSGR